MWTQFWDMHSGGGTKEPPYDKIYIEAPEGEARVIFFNRFGHNPERVTCTCCGDDYSIDESPSLKRLTGYHRGCRTLETPRGPDGRYMNDLKDEWFQEHYYLEPGEEVEAERRGFTVSDRTPWEGYQTLEEYVAREDVLVIYAKDIKPEERQGSVPDQGYVWVD